MVLWKSRSVAETLAQKSVNGLSGLSALELAVTDLREFCFVSFVRIIKFRYRYRECYNGPCNEATQETTWCNLSVCVDSWNMPWPCGEVRQAQKSMRIVGGYEAQRAEVPWVCILELRSDPICGASVIAPKWNIGASHCVSQTFDRPEQMRILCGVHDRTITEFGSQTGQVLQYYKHPKYSGSTIDYDLCLFGRLINIVIVT